MSMTSESRSWGRRTKSGTVLSVSDLQVSFPSEAGPVRAVRGLSFDLAAGETMAIVGESGSGKSVSSYAMMGLLPETARISGSVKLHGDELIGLSDARMSKIRGKELAIIFQDPLSALTPVYTIGDQIVEAMRTHDKSIGKPAAAKRAVELLDLVGIPNPSVRARSFPHEFSGGMRQRAMIAMAIANDPDVIIADEPTTALDVTIQAQVLEVLKTAQRETGAAMIMITHDLGVVAGIADRVTVMYAGRPVEQGNVDEIFYTPRMPYTIGLLGSVPRPDTREQQALATLEGNPPSVVDLPPGCPFAARCPMVQDDCRADEPELALTDQPGHTAACIYSDTVVQQKLTYADIFPTPAITAFALDQADRQDRTTILELRGLKRHYPLMKGAVFRRRVGTVYAVDGIDLDIKEGETLGLVGESGCGKSTTLLEVLQLQPPTGGDIVVLGKDVRSISSNKERRAVRRDLQVVFQDPMASLDPRMLVYDIIAEPMTVQKMSDQAIESRVHELLDLVGLDRGFADRYPQHFSGGQRQRIGIARALALEPRLLVLDEPVSALDVSIQAGVINLLDDLKARLGLSYLFVAHDLSVVRHIADRVAVMYLGNLVEIGDTTRIFEHPTHPYTQALLSAIPIPDPHKERGRERILLQGDLPSPADPPSGCKFRTRCPKFLTLRESEQQICIETPPALFGLGVPDHLSACHYNTELKVI